MRPRVSHSLTLVLTTLITSLVSYPYAKASAEPEFGIRAEGYLGYSNLDIFFTELEAFQGGGTGSVSVIFDQFYLQADVFGNVMDFENDIEAKNVGPGLHLGWRDPSRGSAGIVGTYNDLDLGGGSVDVYRAGFEGEAYLDSVTFGLNTGYLDFESFGSGSAYIEGLVAAYPIEEARLSFRIGGVGIEDDDPLISLGIGAEYLVGQVAAPFVRWEASLPDTFDDLVQHSIVAGLTLYWGSSDGPTLKRYDRTYFKSSCGGLLLLGRLC